RQADGAAAARLDAAVPPPRAEVHAPRVPHLRHGLPVPERGRLDAARLQHDAGSDRPRARLELRCDDPAQPAPPAFPHGGLLVAPDTLPRSSDLPPPVRPGGEAVIDVDHFNLWYGATHALK